VLKPPGRVHDRPQFVHMQQHPCLAPRPHPPSRIQASTTESIRNTRRKTRGSGQKRRHERWRSQPSGVIGASCWGARAQRAARSAAGTWAAAAPAEDVATAARGAAARASAHARARRAPRARHLEELVLTAHPHARARVAPVQQALRRRPRRREGERQRRQARPACPSAPRRMGRACCPVRAARRPGAPARTSRAAAPRRLARPPWRQAAGAAARRPHHVCACAAATAAARRHGGARRRCRAARFSWAARGDSRTPVMCFALPSWAWERVWAAGRGLARPSAGVEATKRAAGDGKKIL
jgi:hypothetical protein